MEQQELCGVGDEALWVSSREAGLRMGGEPGR